MKYLKKSKRPTIFINYFVLYYKRYFGIINDSSGKTGRKNENRGRRAQLAAKRQRKRPSSKDRAQKKSGVRFRVTD